MQTPIFRTKQLKLRNVFFASLACITSLASGCAMGVVSESELEDEELGVVGNAIVNGTNVTEAQVNRYLPLEQGCSAVLITNDLYLTNEHCYPFPTNPTVGNVTLPPTVTNGAPVTRTGGQFIFHPSNDPYSWGVDYTMIRVSSPFPVDGQTTGFRRKIWNGLPADLVGQTAIVVGASNGPNPAEMGVNDNGYEINNFDIVAVETGVRTVQPRDSMNNPIPGAVAKGIRTIAWIQPPAGAGYTLGKGDSGAGVFLNLSGERFLLGINTGNSTGLVGSAYAAMYPNAVEVIVLDASDVAAGRTDSRTFINERVNQRSFDNVGCSGDTKKVFLGDYDADGQTDILCHNKSTGVRSVKYANRDGSFESSWETFAGNWCTHAGARVHTGDFDGDQVDDLLCTDDQGRKWVDYGHNGFAGSDFHFAANWCHTFNLLVGKFDDDDSDDLLCHDAATGRIWLDFASDNFEGTDKSFLNNNWCSHAGSKAYAGDFSGDGRDDILCHDTAGRNFIEFATAGGNFFTAGQNWAATTTFCRGASDKVYVADLDGDRKDDLLCRTTAGVLSADYAMDGLTNSDWTENTGWCTHAGATFHTPKSFDANTARNSAADMFCHDTSGDVYMDYR